MAVSVDATSKLQDVHLRQVLEELFADEDSRIQVKTFPKPVRISVIYFWRYNNNMNNVSSKGAKSHP